MERRCISLGQPLVKAEDNSSEGQSDLVARGASGKKVLYALVTVFATIATLVAVVDFSPQKEAAPVALLAAETEEPKLFSGWNETHVEAACRGVKVPDARRLSSRGSVRGAESHSDGQRRLGEPAVFDPSLLYGLHVFGEYKMPYYGSIDLEKDFPNEAKEAVFFFHGAMRNAQDYFCAMRATIEATIKDGQGPIDRKVQDYVVIAPKYHYFADVANHSEFYGADEESETDELFWNGSRPYGDWRGGADAAPGAGSTSSINAFEVIDAMILALGDPAKFPKLERIVLVGHSAGGQAVQRYAVVSHLRPQSLADDETTKDMKGIRKEVDIRYVVANPSSYCYLDKHRWKYTWDESTKSFTDLEYEEYEPTKGRRGWDDGGSQRRRQLSKDKLAPWGVTSPTWQKHSRKVPFMCRTSKFNDWHYGLNFANPDFGNLLPYLTQHPALHRAAEFYAARDVIYLVGQNDTCSDNMLGGFDTCSPSCWQRNNKEMPCSRNSMDVRCPAMLQGPSRNARGRGYMHHLRTIFNKPVHRLYQIPGVGHEAQRMLNSPLGRIAMFEKDLDQKPTGVEYER